MTDLDEAANDPTEPGPDTTSMGGLPPAVGAAAAEAAQELPRKAADAVQLLVDTIHDKAVRPAVLATRAIVFGLIVATLAVILVIVGAVAVIRMFDVYVFGRQVWLSYIMFGGALTLGGLAVWTRRTARPSRAR